MGLKEKTRLKFRHKEGGIRGGYKAIRSKKRSKARREKARAGDSGKRDRVEDQIGKSKGGRQLKKA